ncbi:hypothetical protein ACEPAG_3961 [Sanghuangporus baumii]
MVKPAIAKPRRSAPEHRPSIRHLISVPRQLVLRFLIHVLLYLGALWQRPGQSKESVIMHGRENTGHNGESNPSGFPRDDDESMKSEAGTGNDAVGSGSTFDARPDTRRSSSISMTSLGNNAPTMRSRVTVVCAECKKQKLKCDRRIPCESCVKRNTVARCVYTPAAIEKVDMTSINNRLRVVEGSLNALGVPTQGHPQSFAAFSSLPQLNVQHTGALPFLNAGASGFPPTTAQAANLTIKSSPRKDGEPSDTADGSGLDAPPPRMLALAKDSRCASAVAPLDGTTALWMRELAGETGQVSSDGTSMNRSLRDLEPCPRSASAIMGYNKSLKVDLRPIDREFLGSNPAFGCGTEQDLDAHQLLSLHAGLGMSSSPVESAGRSPEAEAEHRSHRAPHAVDSLVSIYTPLANQLLAQFPSRCRRREMLLRLGTAFMVEGISCVPFGAFCESIETVLLSALSLHGASSESSVHPPMPAFSVIAEAAAGLAVGALIWASEPSVARTAHDEALRRIICRTIDPFLSATAARSSRATLDGTSSSRSTAQDNADLRHDEGDLERPNAEEAFALYRLAQLALSIHTARHGHAALDISLIHARILSAHYLFVAQSTSAELSDALLPSEFPALVGALIWEARGMGLGIDPDEFDQVGETVHDVAADGGNDPSIPLKREDGGEILGEPPRGKRMSLFVKEVRRRMWWWIIWLDFLVSDAYGYNAAILPGEYSTRLPLNVDDTCFRPSSVVLPPPDDNCFEKNTAFLITKLRLLEIAKQVPVRVLRSGVVPKSAEDIDNATIATSQKLADDIMQWLDELPERFKLDASDNDSSPVTFSQSPMTSLRPQSHVEEEHKASKAMLIAQQCDMAFRGYHTLIRLFTPRLPSSTHPVTRSRESFLWPGDKTMSADRQLAGLKVIQPALALVHAAEVQMTRAPDLSRAIYHMYLFPRRLFDAAVVLAYTAIQHPLYTAPIVIEAVRTVRDILSRVLQGSAARGDVSANRETEAEWVLEFLLKRAEKAKTQTTPIMAGVKRKHEEIETEVDQLGSPFHFPFMGTGIVNVYEAPTTISVPRRGHIDRSYERGEVVPDRSQSCATPSTRASSGSRNDDCRSRIPTNIVSEHRERSVPAVSIRHRVRDSRTKVDVPRVGLNHVESGFRSPSSLMLPPQSVSQQTQRTISSGPSVSSSSSGFASEAMSASPISPAAHYDLVQGPRPPASGMNNGLFAANAVPTGSISFQGPQALSATHQYPSPAIQGPAFGTPLHLQHQHNREFPMPAVSPVSTPERSIQYNVHSAHPSPTSQRVQESEAIGGARSWTPSSYGDQGQSNLDRPHAVEMFPPDQHARQSQSGAWTGGENMLSSDLPQPWNMGLFTNWHHDS